jgi:hypothetical protein
VHVRKLTQGNQRTTALSLAGKHTVVAEKHCIRSAQQDLCPHPVNALYKAIVIVQNVVLLQVVLFHLRIILTDEALHYSGTFNR